MHQTRTMNTFRNAALCLCCAILWILISARVSQRSTGFAITYSSLHPSTRSNIFSISSRNEADHSLPASLITIPASLITINVDTTRETAADNQLYQEVTQRIQGINHPDDANLHNRSEKDENLLLWTRLSGNRVVTTANTTDLPEVYASARQEGAVVFLQNRQNIPVNVTLRTILHKGVYTAERLTISPGDSSPQVRLQRLEGADLSGKYTVVKPCHLESGQICIVRFTDTARAARVEYENLLNQIHSLAIISPEPARKLRRILHEGDPYLGGVSASRRDRGFIKRLGCIHRLLLLTSQAEALQHNNLERKTTASEAGKRVMTALDHLASSLSETSAVLLGLVPQIENDAFSPPVIANKNTKPALTLTSFHHHQLNSTEIGVSLANTGKVPVTLVKIGLDTTGLPAGTKVEPSDPSVFATLRPGQTVRAVFQVNVPSNDVDMLKRLRGEISYFAEAAPAKLRPQLW